MAGRTGRHRLVQDDRHLSFYHDDGRLLWQLRNSKTRGKAGDEEGHSDGQSSTVVDCIYESEFGEQGKRIGLPELEWEGLGDSPGASTLQKAVQDPKFIDYCHENDLFDLSGQLCQQSEQSKPDSEPRKPSPQDIHSDSPSPRSSEKLMSGTILYLPPHKSSIALHHANTGTETQLDAHLESHMKGRDGPSASTSGTDEPLSVLGPTQDDNLGATERADVLSISSRASSEIPSHDEQALVLQSARKRALSLDHDTDALTTMDLQELQAEKFNSPTSWHTRTFSDRFLNEKLTKLSMPPETGAMLQGEREKFDFFERMSLESSSLSAKIIARELGRIISELDQIRREKRDTILKFEKEIAERDEALNEKASVVDGKLGEVKRSGGQLVEAQGLTSRNGEADDEESDGMQEA